MSFAPFDGVLLDDPRDPIPGALAVLLHLRVEREQARAARRPALGREAVLARARACQDLLAQGLHPAQLRSLDLPLGRAQDAASLASLIAHLEGYLAAVDAAGCIEPMAALWTSAAAQEAGDRAFWVERGPEDGPLDAHLEDLSPPRLRALLALTELGPVRFRLATRRGSGARGLFETREPHLVAQLLPTLEALAAHLERFGLEAPEGWGANPWGAALDGLFEGPLALDDGGREALRRALLPTPGAVLRAAVEQVRAWADEGFAPGEITLAHPEAERLAPLLDALLGAEGLGLAGRPGAPLLGSRDWAPLVALLEGLEAGDPARVGAALAESTAAPPLGPALRVFAEALQASDEAGAESLVAVQEGLALEHRRALESRWGRVASLASKLQTLDLWAADLKNLALGFALLGEGTDFHPALGLLESAWKGDRRPVGLRDLLDALRAFLEVGTTAPRPRPGGGVNLVAPGALARGWRGGAATLLLDLGEGAWPAAPGLPPDLDEERRALLNAALRKAPFRAGFPPSLQTFRLPRAEEDEALPRAFHAEAFGFNTALALTRERLVALSAATDAEGRRRAQGPFWTALEGAGSWSPRPDACASRLRYRWSHGASTDLDRARQAGLRVLDPEALPAFTAEPAAADRVPDWWREGLDPAHPVSPTRLEALAACPFRVFAQRGLRLEVWPEGPATPRDIGSAAHGLLQHLLAGLEGAPHWPAAFLARHGLESPEALALEAVVAAAWTLEGPRVLAGLELGPAEKVRVALGVEELMGGLAALLAWDLGQTQPLPEERSGLGLQGEGPWTRVLVGLEHPVGPVALLDPPRWFQGRVDRLERWNCGEEAFLRVADYKGSRPEALKRYGENDGFTAAHLQLPLYQRLLEAEHGLPASAWLLPLRGPLANFEKPLPAMFAAGDAEGRARLLERVSRLLARAEAGSFPPVPGETCNACSLAALCGRPVDLEALDDEAGEGDP